MRNAPGGDNPVRPIAAEIEANRGSGDREIDWPDMHLHQRMPDSAIVGVRVQAAKLDEPGDPP